MSRDHSITLGNRVTSKLPFKLKFGGSPTVWTPRYFFTPREIRVGSIVGYLQMMGRGTQLVLGEVTGIRYKSHTTIVAGYKEPETLHLLHMRRIWELETSSRLACCKGVWTIVCLLRPEQ